MVKIMMKIGNHFNSNNRSRYSVPNNQVMFGLNGNRKVNKLRAPAISKSCDSCIPPSSGSFDSILQENLEQNNNLEHKKVLHKSVVHKKESHKISNRINSLHKSEQSQRKLHEKEKREREQRERERRERERRERERREREQRGKERRQRDQRDKEQRDKEQREREQRGKERRDRERRQRDQRDKEQHEREQHDREQREKKDRINALRKNTELEKESENKKKYEKALHDMNQRAKILRKNRDENKKERDKQLQQNKQRHNEWLEKKLHRKEEADKRQREREQREKQQREKQQREREQREREQREREQREREQREKQQREREQREKQQREREQREREQREREQREKEQREKEQREKQQREKQQREREQREREQREKQQREREQHEKEQREREQREKEQREKEQREKEQREKEQREKELHEKALQERKKLESSDEEKKPPKEKELGEIFAESPTSVLTNDFEGQVMNNNKHVLLLFYAPWCGWCKKIAPDFIKATQDLQSKSDVELMVIDATQHQISHPKVQLQGFPTVILFKKDDKANPVEYNGNRTADDLVEFIDVQAYGKVVKPKETELGKLFSEASTSVLTNDFEGQVMNNNKHVLLLFYAPWCGWCKKMAPDFIKASQDLQSKSDVELMVVDATQHQVKHPKIQLQGFPTVFLFKKDDKANPVEYNGNRTADDLVEYIDVQVYGKVVKPKESELGKLFSESPTSVLTNDFDDRVMNNNKHVLLLLYAPWCGWCKKIAPDFIKATEELQNNSSVELMVVDATQHEVKHPKVHLQGFPTIILFKKDDKTNPVEYNGDRSTSDFIKFVNTNIGGENIQLKVQETSEESNKVIDITNNFNQLVMDSSEDIIVMFYAPWCGWCKKMLPDYSKLVEKFKDHSSKLKIMKMDATANQVKHDNIKIYGFPLVHYFKAGDKQNPVEYKGNRSLDDMVNYINANKTF